MALPAGQGKVSTASASKDGTRCAFSKRATKPLGAKPLGRWSCYMKKVCGQKAGACRDLLDDENFGKLLEWIRMWRHGQFARDQATSTWWRAGGIVAEDVNDEKKVVWLWAESLWVDALNDFLSAEAAAPRTAGGRRKKQDDNIVKKAVGERVITDEFAAILPFDGQVGPLVEE